MEVEGAVKGYHRAADLIRVSGKYHSAELKKDGNWSLERLLDLCRLVQGLGLLLVMELTEVGTALLPSGEMPLFQNLHSFLWASHINPDSSAWIPRPHDLATLPSLTSLCAALQYMTCMLVKYFTSSNIVTVNFHFAITNDSAAPLSICSLSQDRGHSWIHLYI